MTKQEFIDEIKSRLNGLPEEEIQKSLDYYSEMIDDRIDDGMEEEEAVGEIGSVDDAVKGWKLSRCTRSSRQKQSRSAN